MIGNVRVVGVLLACAALARAANSTTATPGYSGDQCESEIFPCSNKIGGNLVLIVFYGLTLGVAAKLISDGAELLLDLNFPAAIVGGVVLPVLGAVPDSAMILVSGLGPGAQQQLSVGMGTLAGSTILLLTVAWAFSLLVGRVDIHTRPDGSKQGLDKTCTRFSFLTQGVEVNTSIKWVAAGMLATSLPYLVVQSSDWVFGPTKINVPQPSYVKWAAFATMIICFIGFVLYLVSQVESARRGNNAKVLEHEKKKRIIVSAAHAFLNAAIAQQARNIPVVGESAEEGASRQNVIDNTVRNAASKWKLKTRANAVARNGVPSGSAEDIHVNINDVAPLVKATEQEAEEEEPKWRVAVKSVSQLVLGVGMVTFFSDPMCDALTALTDPANQHIPIGAFYLSFVVTPLCSNASELVSSILFAMKKEKENISLTYSQIYGACIMNNTLCLGVFCALIFFRDLEWYYSAEVTMILVFEAALGAVALTCRHIYPLWLLLPVLAFYPLSIGGVAFLENVLHWG